MYPACWSVAKIYPPSGGSRYRDPAGCLLPYRGKRCCLYLIGMRAPISHGNTCQSNITLSRILKSPGETHNFMKVPEVLHPDDAFQRRDGVPLRIPCAAYGVVASFTMAWYCSGCNVGIRWIKATISRISWSL